MKRSIACAGVACALFVAAPAFAAVTTSAEAATVVSLAPGTFSYSVGGWAGGGTVTGTFAGLDGDGNGQLSTFDGEITGFTMAYDGGAIVGAFGLGFANLFGLVYDLDGGPLGDGLVLDIEGIGATTGTYSFLLGPGPVAPCGTGLTCAVLTGPDAVTVAEPGTLAAALAALAFVGALRRRK